MKILFVISLLSFFALVWAAIAVTRHIRRSPALPTEHSLEQAPRPPTSQNIAEGRSQAHGRADWAYFKKDSGDLNDPALPKRSRPASTPTRKAAARRA